MNQNKNQTNHQITELERKIARARKYLNALWNAKGYTDAEVLHASIVVDMLMNKYERLLKEERDESMLSNPLRDTHETLHVKP